MLEKQTLIARLGGSPSSKKLDDLWMNENEIVGVELLSPCPMLLLNVIIRILKKCEELAITLSTHAISNTL